MLRFLGGEAIDRLRYINCVVYYVSVLFTPSSGIYLSFTLNLQSFILPTEMV